MKLYKYNFWNDISGFDDGAIINDPVRVLNNTDAAPADYTLQTGVVADAIKAWDKYAFYACPVDTDDTYINNLGMFANFRDWKCLASEVGKAVEAKSGGVLNTGLTDAQWGLLDVQDKLITAIYRFSKLTDAQRIDAVPNAMQRAGIKSSYDVRMTVSRKKRFQKPIRGYIYDALTTTTQGTSLLKNIEGLGLVNSYYGGLEGIDEGDTVSGLGDWIKTQNDYLTSGLTTKTLTFKTGYDMTILKNSLIDRLNGLY